MNKDEAQLANEIARALLEYFEFLPLSVRYRAAHAAIDVAREWVRSERPSA